MTGGAQRAFRFEMDPAFGPDAFIVAAPNRAAVRMLSDPGAWPTGRLALVGPTGAGKSHLVRIWASAVGALVVPAGALDGAALPEGPVAIEDADRLPGPAAETALFHLLNAAAANRVPVLLSARSRPARWRIALPDLASRLATAGIAEIDPPDDGLLAGILDKQAGDRGLVLPENAVAALLRRMERSFDGARRVVEAIDRLAMARKKPVTRDLALDALRSLTMPDATEPPICDAKD